MITMPATEVTLIEPEFSDAERYALAAFLAGYRGLTRDAYALDLRGWYRHMHDRRRVDEIRQPFGRPLKGGCELDGFSSVTGASLDVDGRGRDFGAVPTDPTA